MLKLLPNQIIKISNSDTSNRRLFLDLKNIFDDHRQQAIVSVNENVLKTIYDLKNHIRRIFKIKAKFYLANDKGYYLNPLESVDILRDGEVVCLNLKGTKVDTEQNIVNGLENGNETVVKETKEKPKTLGLQDIIDFSEVKVKRKFASEHVFAAPVNPVTKNKTIQEINVPENKKTIVVLRDEIITPLKTTEVNENLSKTLFTSWSDSEMNLEPSKTLIAEWSDVDDTTVKKRKRNESESKNLNSPLPKYNRKRLSGIGDTLKQILNATKENNETSPSKTDETNPPKTDETNPPETEESTNIEKLTDIEMSFNSEFITTRKRHRVRHRKSKIPVDETSTETPVAEFRPPKTKAAPKIHKHFPENDTTVTSDDDSLLSMTESNFSHSTPCPSKMSVIPEESVVMAHPLMEVIEMSKVLTGKPKVNSKILFKTLKLDENYSPIVSDYIYGEVTAVTEGGDVQIKILKGQAELKDPEGKFSIIENGDPDNSTLNTQWNLLLDKRLVVKTNK